MGAFAMPELFTETKMAQNEALKRSMPSILKGWEQWGELTGRLYRPVETYRSEDADTLILTMGSLGETAAEAVDLMREEGKSVGLVRLRLWRPFPFAAFREAVAHAKLLIVVDRAISYGGPGGPVSSEVRAALYEESERPRVIDFIAGLAGRDVSPKDFMAMVERSIGRTVPSKQEDYDIYGVRE
jgi:pyruvate ferredoxin oxidoreductase alpha subunit